MKSRSIIITALLIAVSTTAIFVGCKKEKQENQKEQKIETTASPESENMDEYLISFKKELLSAQKGGESISLEQAQRDLGNLLNFDFGDANYATNVFHYDTICTKTTVCAGKVEMAELARTYSSIFDNVVATYNSIELQNKSVYSIVCSFSDNSKNGEAELTTILTTRAYEETTNNTDDWRAGNLSGRCDGQLVGVWGAPEEVVSMLLSNMGSWLCPNGGRVYFTDETSCYKSAMDDDMIDPNSPCGRRLFYMMNENLHLDPNQICIPHEDIVYYYNQARLLHTILGSTFQPNPFPSNHVVTDYHIRVQHSIADHIIWWCLEVWHGKPNCTGTQPAI